MTAYYNEIEPYAADWLRNLIDAGLIAPGDVDERDIREVQPDELKGYTQCHFFAGPWRLVVRAPTRRLARRPARVDGIMSLPTVQRCRTGTGHR